jgi:hypothetical protein
MSDTPIEVIVNCETGEVTERPLSAEQLAQLEANAAAFAEAEALRLSEEAAKEEARLSARAKLIEQGFTDAEIDVMYPSLVGLAV